MNKILVPYDFSEVATHALNFAAELSDKDASCSVTLINVIEQPTPDTIKTMGVKNADPMQSLYIKKLIDKAKEKMEEVMADSTYKDIDLKYKIVLGQPFKEIAEEISTENIDLVVMGTSGASGAEEFLVGSNAERMVRFSKCPVITLSEATPVDKIDEMVFASNFEEVPKSFVDRLVDLQKMFNAKMKLVKINTPSSFTTTRHDKKQMEQFIEKNNIGDCTYDIYNYSNEEDGIVAYAEDTGADLIAIGTKQRKGFGHFLAGSIAEDVVNDSKVPVWTFGLEQA